MTFRLVNVIKGNSWNSESEFDKEKDKSRFRDYDFACERVKAFYREQHGWWSNLSSN
jgi:inositol oxygenase